MSNQAPLANNHAHEPVPESERVSGLRIGTIIIGIAITLPAFMVGSSIISSLGLMEGASAILIAGIVLTAVASLTMLVGAHTHLSTYEIIHLTFGTKGSKVVSALLAFTLFGWYGITAILFGQAASETLKSALSLDVAGVWLMLGGSILMIGTTIYGFRAIDKLSRLVVPLLGLTLLTAVWMVAKETSLTLLLEVPGTAEGITGIGAGASLIIGSFMVGVTILPDMSRFARTPSDAVKGAVISYGSGSQAVLLFAGIPVLITGENDLIVNMTAIGLGLPALAVMLFATWTTNVNNLYSSTLSVSQLLVKWPDWLATVLAGVLGSVLAIVVGIEHFVSFLVFLSIAIPPIAGIYVTDFFLIRKLKISPKDISCAPTFGSHAFTAWVCALLAGVWETQSGYNITGVTALDMVLISGVVFYCLFFFGQKAEQDG